MLALILKPFPHSPDGIRIEPMLAGEEREVRDDLAPGLLAEGFIAEPAAPPAAARGTGSRRGRSAGA